MESEARFKLTPPFMASLWMFVIILILTVVVWTKIPDGQRIITHWNWAGQPDGYSSKPFALLIFPVLALVTTGLIILLASVMEDSRYVQIILCVSMMLMAVGHGLIIWTALGRKLDVNIMWGAIGLLFIVIGNYFPKLRRNRLSGIRTPWTLASELSWNKTHRLGGKLCVMYGLVILVGAFFLDTATLLEVVCAGGLALVLFLSVYSYTIWKSDPDRSTSPL